MKWPINERAEYLRENRPPEYWAQQDIDPFRVAPDEEASWHPHGHDVPRWAVAAALIMLAGILAMVQYLIFID
jgi:hypothetical protein